MRFWKPRAKRLAALVCALALTASLLPTAVFADTGETVPAASSTVTAEEKTKETPAPDATEEEQNTSSVPGEQPKEQPSPEPSESPVNTDATVTTPAPDTGTGSTSAPEATPAGNTDDIKEPEESPEPSEEPTDDTTESGEEGTETTDSTTVPSEKPVESPEPSGVPAEEVQLFNAPVQLDLEPAAAPKGIGDETATSNDGIFSVDYYNGPGEKTDLTIIALDEEERTLDTLYLGEVYASSWTMSITLNDAYKTVYEITDVSGGDGVYILDWSEDFKDGQSVTFGWADTPEGGNYGKGTIYIHLKEASHVLNLQNADKDIDLGTILWKEDGNAYQRTTVEAYLNYELVYTAKDLPIANTARNFILDVNDGYYFDTAELQDIKYSSNIDGQTLSYTQSNTRLNFNIAPSEVVKGNNVVKLYFFDYNDVTKVDFNRRLDAVDISNLYHPDSCEDMVISFESKGRTYSFLYKDWQDAIALPRNTKITVSPNLGEGYYFEFWDSYDVAAPHNAMYSVLPDGTWEKEGYGTVYYGVLALTQTLGLEFSDSDYPRVSIYLCMTEGKQDDDKVITYHSNYPAETGLEDETYSQYFYNYGAIFRGARIQDDMFQPEGYELVCWTTNQNGTGDKYMPGDLYGNEKGDDDLTLYAQWKKIDTPTVEPSVALKKTILNVERDGNVITLKDDEMLKVGDVVTYQIEVKNTGNVPLSGLTITDTLTAQGAKPVDLDDDDGNFAWKQEAGKWIGTVSNVELGENDTKTYKYTYTVVDGDKGKTITNTAAIEGENPTDDGKTETEVEDPDVTVTKSLTAITRNGESVTPIEPTTELKVGDVITYEITVTNTGNVTLEGLTVTDTFNGAGSPSFGIDGNGRITMNGNDFTWTPGGTLASMPDGTLAPKDSKTLTYTYTVVEEDLGKTLKNTATVEGGDLPDKPEGEVELPVEEKNPDATIDKELTKIVRNGKEVTSIAANTELKVGDEITYEIKVENTGNVNLSDLTVTDKFSGYAEPGAVQESGKEVTGAAWQKDTTGTAPNWTLTIDDIDLPVGESKTYTYTYTVNQADADKNLTNTAAVTGDGTDAPDKDEDDDKRPVEDDGKITLRPADITIYMGGKDGYEAVMNGNVSTSSNSLPEPGFYITLPDEVNEALGGSGHAVNLSGKITVTAATKAGAERTWTLEKYGDSTSTALINDQEHFVYKIEPGDNQPAIRVAFTDNADNTVTSDAFTLTDNLSNEYQMNLYTGDVDVASISLKIEAGDQTFYCGYDAEGSTPGILTVRYAATGALITPATTNLDAEIAEDTEQFYVEVNDSQKFYINDGNSQAGVTVDVDSVSLLADDLTRNNDDYNEADLYAATQKATSFEKTVMFGKYFDLVDAQNGNAWLTSDQAVTVFWPYPAGTDKNTEFELFHFDGLDREGTAAAGASAIDGATPTEVTSIEKGEHGITFTTSSFSPFVLVWENTQAEQPGDEDKPSGDDNNNNNNNNNNHNNTTNNQSAF